MRLDTGETLIDRSSRWACHATTDLHATFFLTNSAVPRCITSATHICSTTTLAACKFCITTRNLQWMGMLKSIRLWVWVMGCVLMSPTRSEFVLIHDVLTHMCALDSLTIAQDLCQGRSVEALPYLELVMQDERNIDAWIRLAILAPDKDVSIQTLQAAKAQGMSAYLTYSCCRLIKS